MQTADMMLHRRSSFIGRNPFYENENPKTETVEVLHVSVPHQLEISSGFLIPYLYVDSL